MLHYTVQRKQAQISKGKLAVAHKCPSNRLKKRLYTVSKEAEHSKKA